MTVQEAQVEDLHDADDEDFVDELAPGTQLLHGQYTIESFLNSGGFGITYLARDSLDRIVVIKECFPGSFCRRQNASVVARSRAHQAELRSIVRLFTQEARSLAKASHPNIVGVHQVFEDNSTAYMALDYVEGMDLLEIITETPGILTPPHIRGYLMKMLEAVSFVHAQGILHRDISPDNILVRADNQPVLIDFGAAREEASKQSRMLSALRVVKEGYSPQEFYVAGSDQSPSCDLYSLAASFYHVITGDLPPDSQMRLAAAAAGDPDPYTPLGQRTKDFDEVFCSSLDKAISVLPRERIQSAEDWLAMLRGETAVPKAIAQTRRVASPRKVEADQGISKLPLLLGSTAVVLGIAAAGYFVTSGGSDEIVVTAPTPAPVIIPEVVTPEVAEPKAVASEEIVVVEAPLPPVISDIPPELTQVVSALRNSAKQDLVPSLGISDKAIELSSAPALSGAEIGSPFVNVSEIAAAPVEAALIADPIPEVAETPTPLPQSSPVMGGSAFAELPFSISESEPGVVTNVTSGAPFWITEGTRILTIDGQTVATTQDVNAIVAAKAADASDTELRFDVATEAQVSGAAIDRVLTLPQIQMINLLNGLGFEARRDGDTWITTVTEVPTGSAFETGDQLVAFMATSERINDANSLREILERDLKTGTTSFSFAVQRGGQMWVESFNLSN